MTLMTRRSASPLTEMVDWLETVTPFRAAWSEGFIPVEEYREDGQYVVRADLPGIDPDKDISVTVDDGYLVIHGERREEQHDEHRSELRFGSFSRRLPLPKGCAGEDVKASYSAGVLTVTLPVDGEAPEPTKVRSPGRATETSPHLDQGSSPLRGPGAPSAPRGRAVA